MKDFFKMMFASALGVIIASVILSFLSFILLIGIVASLGTATPAYNLQKDSVLKIHLDGIINDRKSADPFEFLFHSSTDSYGLNDMLAAIEKAKTNDKIKGIYLVAGQMSSGYATAEPLRKALLDFKESGKFIIAYGENFNHRSYYVSSVADSVFMNPEGMMDFRGLSSTIQYNKKILEKWGIEMQIFKVGTYKSAVEPYLLDKMSDANRAQVTAFLNDIWGNLLKGISESRGISVEQLNRYADESLIFAAPQKTVDYGLMDGLRYSDEVENCLKALAGIDSSDKLQLAGVENMKQIPEIRKKLSGDKIAVLYAEGEIVADAMSDFYTTGYITAKEYVSELNKLKDDESVKAVVFRVNSPGGSGYVSEQIWHAVEQVRAVKPVVVSMGDYAASGGYYIACGADKIIAEPTTLTGSIGVFGIMPNAAELAKRMGATYDGVSTNKHSNLANETLAIPLLGIGLFPARPLNSDECAMVQAYTERFYDLFLTRVSNGRGKTKEAIDAIGQGRVWTGNQALQLGLVDALGGIDTAIREAAALTETTDYTVKEYPAQKDFWISLFEESSESVQARFSRLLMGKDLYNQKRMLKAWQGYDYRQAVMPEYIVR
ncbi:MAG: signal peptide peptidase SppA [Dysgonamonadaceae bacterium]|jgi:protease-4|nr:signal peptide peptidase SppA [Dysgonamonadaceae bacterium]